MAVAWISNSPVLHVNGGSTANTTFASSPPAGSTVFLSLGAYDPLSANPVVSDNQGNTWARLYSTGSLGNNSAMLYACWAIAGGASLTVTVAANSGAYITGAAAAFTPLVNPANASGTVATDTAATTGQSVSTSGATTQADAVSISVMAQSGPTTLTGYTCSGFTSIWAEPDPNTNQPGGAAYRIETTTGTKTAAWSWGSASGENANSIIAVFQGVSTGTNVAPGVGSVALSGYAPTVARTANQAVAPGVGSLALAGFAPTVARTANVALVPGVASLALAGYAPTVTQGAGLTLTPGVGSLALAGFAPTVARTANQALTPAAASLVLTGFAPTVVQVSASVNLTPGPATLTVTGYAPTLTQSGGNPYPLGSGGGPLYLFPEPVLPARERKRQKRAAEWAAEQVRITERLKKKATPRKAPEPQWGAAVEEPDPVEPSRVLARAERIRAEVDLAVEIKRQSDEKAERVQQEHAAAQVEREAVQAKARRRRQEEQAITHALLAFFE